MIQVSVIIPVRNGAATLGRCLKRLQAQTIADRIEIIVLDSKSTDNSREIALAAGAVVKDIPAGTFNHGLTRNVGAEMATGEYIYFTVQDAWIAEDNMLEQMCSFFQNESVMSVTGMQAVPHETDKNPAKWLRRYTEPVPEIFDIKGYDYDLLPADKKLYMARWDNVNSMYRHSALALQPFLKTELAEDILWAKEALQKGWMIVRDPSLVVYHYHHHTFRYTFRVKYAELYVIKTSFGTLPGYPAFIKPFLQGFKSILLNKNINWYRKPGWQLHNFLFLLAIQCCVLVFRLLFFFNGQKGLDRGLKYFCATIPQGMQSNNI